MGPGLGRPRDHTAANVPNPDGTGGFWETRMPRCSNPDSLRRRRFNYHDLSTLPLKQFTQVTTSLFHQYQKYGFIFASPFLSCYPVTLGRVSVAVVAYEASLEMPPNCVSNSIPSSDTVSLSTLTLTESGMDVVIIDRSQSIDMRCN